MDKIKKLLMTLVKIIFIYAFSGGLYLLMELAFRQYTFLEMFYVAGFVGLIAMFFNNIFSYETDYLIQVAVVGISCTILEGIAGHIWNMDYHIWDYRDLWGSCWNDQINIYFIIVWFVIAAIIIPILDYIDWRLFEYKVDTPPYYKICKKKIFQFKK